MEQKGKSLASGRYSQVIDVLGAAFHRGRINWDTLLPRTLALPPTPQGALPCARTQVMYVLEDEERGLTRNIRPLDVATS